MKTILIFILLSSGFAFAKNKVVNIDEVVLSKKQIVNLAIGESLSPKVSLWTNDERYPAQAHLECVEARIARSSKKGKTYEIDLVFDKNGKRTAYIQLLPGQTTELADVIYKCQSLFF